VSREAIFGRVAAVQRVKDYDEALVCANDTEFGLSAGMVMVNLPTAAWIAMCRSAGAKAPATARASRGAMGRSSTPR
jgi:alpha-ketoglutaric semialdehyde dehydrogenase